MEQTRAGLLLCPFSRAYMSPMIVNPLSYPPCSRGAPRHCLDLLTVLLTSSPFSRLLRCRLDLLTLVSGSSPLSRPPRPGLEILAVVLTSSPWYQYPRCRLSTLLVVSASSFPPSSPDHRGGHAPPSQRNSRSLSSRWSGRVRSGFAWVDTSAVGLSRHICFDLPFLHSSRCC